MTCPSPPGSTRCSSVTPGSGSPSPSRTSSSTTRAATSAALITYYGFLSLFPLLLLVVTILGYVLVHDPGLQNQIIDSAVSDFPIVGDELKNDITGFHGSDVGPGPRPAQPGVRQPRRGPSRPARDEHRLGGRRATAGPTRFGRGCAACGCCCCSASASFSRPHYRRCRPGRRLTSTTSPVVGTGVRILAIVVGVAINVCCSSWRSGCYQPPMSVHDVWVGAVVAALFWQGLQMVGHVRPRPRDQGLDRGVRHVRSRPRAMRGSTSKPSSWSSAPSSTSCCATAVAALAADTVHR